ncbi:MAG: DUF2254 family protein [Candidatus Promineifilaceae bacterium]|nr:DUF2254 family protein [Candidatus Promineifilaceae bacterium]
MSSSRDHSPTDIASPGPFSDLPQAWHDFLRVPTLMALGMLALAVVMIGLDRISPELLKPVHDFLSTYLFADASESHSFLGTVLGGLITATALTITTLLIALQQTASKLGIQVSSHFLDRRRNQLFFGFLVGVTVYVAVTYAAGGALHLVYSATLGLLLLLLVIYALIMLLYMTVNQMRPVVLISHIHDQTLRAYGRLEREVLARTWREAEALGLETESTHRRLVLSHRDGYVTDIDLDRLEKALAEQDDPEAALVVHAPIGAYVAYNDILAEVYASVEAVAAALVEPARDAFGLQQQRDIHCDPNYGLYHLEVITWPAVSTAISDPAIGVLTLNSARDIASRWLAGEDDRRSQSESDGEERERSPTRLPIVYPDTCWVRFFDLIEAMPIVASESIQHQVFTQGLDVLRELFERLPPEHQRRAADIVRRWLPAAGDFVLARELELALERMEETLREGEYQETADDVRRTLDALRGTVGVLHSRSTRASEGK